MIIVTGGAGFIGSYLVSYLNEQGIYDIIIVDEFGTSERWNNLLGLKFKDFIHKDDFAERIKRDSLPHSVTSIIHLGACSSTTEKNVDYLYRNNFLYTKAIAQFTLNRGIQFIYASSAATYGDGSLGYEDDHGKVNTLKPLNAYGFSKQLFDLWVVQNELTDRMVGLKFFNVYGPHETYKEEMRSVVIKSFHQIKNQGYVSLFKSYRDDYKDGEQKRDFFYVRDGAKIMHWFLKNPSVSGIYNLGSGVSRTWKDLAKSVFSAMNVKEDIRFIEMPENLRNQYQYFTEAPIQKLVKAGYSEPMTSLEDGVREYVEWLNQGK